MPEDDEILNGSNYAYGQELPDSVTEENKFERIPEIKLNLYPNKRRPVSPPQSPSLINIAVENEVLQAPLPPPHPQKSQHSNLKSKRSRILIMS